MSLAALLSAESKNVYLTGTDEGAAVRLPREASVYADLGRHELGRAMEHELELEHEHLQVGIDQPPVQFEPMPLGECIVSLLTKGCNLLLRHKIGLLNFSSMHG